MTRTKEASMRLLTVSRVRDDGGAGGFKGFKGGGHDVCGESGLVVRERGLLGSGLSGSSFHSWLLDRVLL